jgi:hypothetical protein
MSSKWGKMAASGHFPPLAIVSAQGLLSDGKRHFGKNFSTIEI